MLKTRLPRLARLRTLHSSAPVLDRPPTFTTPAPSPLPPTTPTKAGDSAPLAPLPPTNLPVEDYASPLLHTASFFSTLFRYSVYSSVGIVTLALTSLVGVHLYVEHSALALPPPQLEDPEEWFEETGQGWSGKHLAGRGGTDPRLGLLARAAVRGAWISMNWASGSAASPIAAAAQHQPSSSTFATVGPRMIGQDQTRATRGTPVADSGWLMAEQYLVYALRKAEERGISLIEPADWEKQIERGGVDRAAVELEERLAGLRERIGGRLKLEQAREGWERIYYALAQTPTTDVSTKEGKKLVEWEQRERVLASRKLGELGGRIAELWGKDSDEGKFEANRARDWFIRGLTPVLNAHLQGGGGGTVVQALEPAVVQTKHVTPSSSFFSFWSRSHPPSTPASPSPSSHPELSLLTSLVSTTTPGSLPPSTCRAVLSTLVSLETFLARTLSDLASAQAVQSTALDYAQRLSSSHSSDTTATTSPSQLLPPTTNAQASKLLTSLYLTTRISALQTHLAECTLARLEQQSRKPNASGRRQALESLHAVRESIESVLVALPPASPRDKKESKELVFSKNLVGVDAKGKEMMEEQSKRIRRDADKVDKIVQQLVKFLEGDGTK